MVTLGVGTALALFFRSLGITESSIVLLYLLSVVIASVMTGRAFGIVASVVAVVLFNFLFTEPRFTFVVNDPQYLVTFPVMLSVAGISSELTARIRRQAEEASRRELLTKQLYQSSRSLLGAQGRMEVLRAAARHLSDLTGRPVYCAVDGDMGGAVFVGTDGREAPEYLGEPVQELLDARGAPPQKTVSGDGMNWTLVPVGAQGRSLAVVLVQTGAEGLGPVARESLSSVGVQLALALDREEISRREQNARIEIERERLRANLLQSISHDLRSPLAAIVGSASTLLENTDLDPDTRADLVRSVRDDARWLTGLVENLLSLTRADGGAVRFQGSVEVIDDILSSALARIERIHESHSVKVELASVPVLVRVDGGLVEQLVVNLLENVIQHTPPGSTVRIVVRRTDTDAVVTFCDDGPGLSSSALEHAFERFYTERSLPDARRGMGLGLSICRSIAQAHGGTITVRNRDEGGACFEVRLPALDTVVLQSESDDEAVE